MARIPPEKPARKGGKVNTKARKGDEPELSRARAVLPPPAGLDVMPRPFQADDLRDDGKTRIVIEATPTECAALAQAYGLSDVAALSGTLSAAKRGPVVRVTGTLTARVTQTCVVTLEPFEVAIKDKIERDYAPEAYVLAAWEELSRLEAAGSQEPPSDPPDPFLEGGKIDLGALLAESLALALDPYPKKPGAEFASPEDLSAGPDESPFAVLARLKGQGGPDGAA